MGAAPRSGGSLLRDLTGEAHEVEPTAIPSRRPLAEALESRTLLDAELAVDFNPATVASSPGGYVTLGDVDGSGAILANDFAAVKGRFFDNFLPAATAAAAKRSDEVSAASSLFATTPVL